MGGNPGFLGMRGTGDWATDQRPKSWREVLLFLYPNGMVPLTAILSKMRSEAVTDPQFYWWTKGLATQRAAVTGVYTDALSTPYVSGATAGTVLYFKMSASDVTHFRKGHQVLLRDASNFTVDCVGKVSETPTVNGASSYIKVTLLEADDNGVGNDLSDCDTAIIIGNINEEGAPMPEAISYDPVKFYNYTQIFRTPLSITRTARLTRLRTGDQYKEMKREALELHGIEMEKAFLFGIPTEGTGTGGKPERTTAGIKNFIKANVPANVDDFRLNSSYSGKDWTDDGGGEDWFDSMLEQCFRYGKGEKLALCGSGALAGINKLVKSGTQYTIQAREGAYGIKVLEWITPLGTLYLKTHPLLSQEVTCRNCMIIMEPENLIYRYITDTTFFGMGTSGQASPGAYGEAGSATSRRDGTDEEFLTECGLELHHPDTFMYLDGVGLDNQV
jgi:hypothetical protein